MDVDDCPFRISDAGAQGSAQRFRVLMLPSDVSIGNQPKD